MRLGVPVPEFEALTDADPTWFYRELAVLDAEDLAKPLREQRQRREAKEAKIAAEEQRKREDREQKRNMARTSFEGVLTVEPRIDASGQLYWPTATD